jgi:hypothetical protein
VESQRESLQDACTAVRFWSPRLPKRCRRARLMLTRLPQGAYNSRERGLAMRAKLAYPILSALVLVTCWGCASVAPQKKATVNAPKIIEEDVTESRSPGPFEPQAPMGSGQGTVPPGFGEGGPVPQTLENQQTGSADPGKRPKRRFKYQDRKGSGRDWEPLPDRTDVP